MAVSLKPLSDQVMVIVGGSSGIGLATARRAAAAGARVVLAARNSEALDEAVVAIRNKGGQATALDLDIADEGRSGACSTMRSNLRAGRYLGQRCRRRPLRPGRAG
jgi:NAD(P)-dependent dehydrogenase (short-subunit alcohol dehydrogenase family)